ncbi:MAG: protein-tyrosine phosphatase family protein, partial [Planctomycetota bacterium]
HDVPWDFASKPQDVVKLVASARDLAMLVKSGHRVLIVCNMGMNRSGLMTALVLMNMGMSWRKALKLIRRRHGCTLSNDSFVQVLPFAQRIISGGL